MTINKRTIAATPTPAPDEARHEAVPPPRRRRETLAVVNVRVSEDVRDLLDASMYETGATLRETVERCVRTTLGNP